MEKFFKLITHYLLLIIVFLTPLFFLPTTQEFFVTNKMYLLTFSSLILLTISTIKYFLSKKIQWQSLFFDDTIILFLITIGLSIILSSPNKVQALITPNFGLITFFSLTVLYFYLSRSSFGILPIAYTSSFFIALITIIFFFQPFKNINLPSSIEFLKNPFFTPLGDQINLSIFLGFFVIYSLIKIIITPPQSNKKTAIIDYSLLIINLIALSLTLYQIFKPQPQTNNQLPSIVLPPFKLSWYAAVEILKQPITALFGVGVNNFASIFAKVKDLAYNQSTLWQISSFNFSRSVIFHILTETGLFGLIAFVLLIIKTIRKAQTKKSDLLLLIYLLIISLFFPPSLIFFFLFFLFLADLSHYEKDHSPIKIFDLKEVVPFYLGAGIIFIIFLGFGFYFVGRAYLAEINFKKYINALNNNQGSEAYNRLRQAIILNPFVEIYPANFAQLNLLIANNIIAQKTQEAKEKKQEQPNLSETDRQNISQAIQTAIAEAKTVVALNPQKAINWQSLGDIYRAIINMAQGADVWTISAYQRAIVADPQNPSYRLNLGGIYYSLANYDEAKNLFQQAISLKPDWANAYYNLAWAAYQKQDYQLAVNAMEGVLKLLDPIKNKEEYDKAKKELEEFKKKIANQPTEKGAETTGSNTSQQNKNNLTLPTPLPTNNQPPIKLPKEASPEAK